MLLELAYKHTLLILLVLVINIHYINTPWLSKLYIILLMVVNKLTLLISLGLVNKHTLLILIGLVNK